MELQANGGPLNSVVDRDNHHTEKYQTMNRLAIGHCFVGSIKSGMTIILVLFESIILQLP